MIYLAFISEIGRLVDGGYLYKFSFTNQPEVVWGDYFNVAPTIVVPNLVPDEETISEEYKVSSKYHLILATKSSCFSMQDAFDNIIPLAFVDIEKHDLVYYKDNVLKFEFGEHIDITEDKFNECGFEIIEKEELLKESTVGKTKEETNDNLVIETSEEEIVKPLTLSVEQEIKPETIKKILFEHGYTKVQNVYNYGDYAIRGSIIDIFPFDSFVPYKICFDNNIIEKIYSFDKDESNPIAYFNKIDVNLNKNGWWK